MRKEGDVSGFWGNWSEYKTCPITPPATSFVSKGRRRQTPLGCSLSALLKEVMLDACGEMGVEQEKEKLTIVSVSFL